MLSEFATRFTFLHTGFGTLTSNPLRSIEAERTVLMECDVVGFRPLIDDQKHAIHAIAVILFRPTVRPACLGHIVIDHFSVLTPMPYPLSTALQTQHLTLTLHNVLPMTTRAIPKAVDLLRNSPEAQIALPPANGDSDPQPTLASDACTNGLGLSFDLAEDSNKFFQIKCTLDSDSYDINECEFTAMELDAPAHTLSPRALCFQRLRSAETQEDARKRAAYLARNPLLPSSSPLPPTQFTFAARQSIWLCDDARSPIMPSWSDSEDEELEDLDDLKMFFNSPPSSPSLSWSDSEDEELEDLDDLKMFFDSPPSSPSMATKREITLFQSSVEDWSDQEDGELETVEELENFFKGRISSRAAVFAF
ncbi:hypothetical protein BS47DRAFT_1485854 [Hydnum rufescens UP504]|uniref:Uncharacterized protein n=1 Tax=Hydnum rufescens UP504 TaxID=1448309 RepID=A0A9P6AWV2_9AGAM|nr:hypothetical protein BS47DRAFT_1485854 [Hydnum rufescens UP504]